MRPNEVLRPAEPAEVERGTDVRRFALTDRLTVLRAMRAPFHGSADNTAFRRGAGYEGRRTRPRAV